MSDKLTAQAIRAFVASPVGPFWVGQAKQMLLWAADLVDAAEAIARESRKPKETTGDKA